MAWINPHTIEAIIQTDLVTDPYIDHLITHVQGLCELEIGEQTEPVSNKLAAVFSQIVARFWRAGKAASTSPQGYQSERVDDYQYEYPSQGAMLAGFGLTNAETKRLKKAAGQTQLWVQPISRGDGLETAGPGTTGQHPNPPAAAFLEDAAGGDPILYFHEDQLDTP